MIGAALMSTAFKGWTVTQGGKWADDGNWMVDMQYR
jgi:hypothetical protein